MNKEKLEKIQEKINNLAWGGHNKEEAKNIVEPGQEISADPDNVMFGSQFRLGVKQMSAASKKITADGQHADVFEKTVKDFIKNSDKKYSSLGNQEQIVNKKYEEATKKLNHFKSIENKIDEQIPLTFNT